MGVNIHQPPMRRVTAAETGVSNPIKCGAHLAMLRRVTHASKALPSNQDRRNTDAIFRTKDGMKEIPFRYT